MINLSRNGIAEHSEMRRQLVVINFWLMTPAGTSPSRAASQPFEQRVGARPSERL